MKIRATDSQIRGFQVCKIDDGWIYERILIKTIDLSLSPLSERPKTTFKLAGREHMQYVQIAKADIKDYACLLGKGGVA